MNRKSNIVYNVIILACTVGLAITVVALANNTYYADLFTTLLLFLLGAVLAGILNTVLHEWGHVLAGQTRGDGISLPPPLVFHHRQRERQNQVD